VAQEPKLAPYVQQMQTSLGEVLNILADQISIKATTTEGLGFVGRQEGMAAYAVVLLVKIE
jgi:2-C-methyl-D-erythritol 2,4-cyclodiphosphate synthase